MGLLHVPSPVYDNLWFAFFTGALGQLGQGLSRLLKKKYGNDNVVMSDIVRASRDMTETGWYDYGLYDARTEVVL